MDFLSAIREMIDKRGMFTDIVSGVRLKSRRIARALASNWLLIGSPALQ